MPIRSSKRMTGTPILAAVLAVLIIVVVSFTAGYVLARIMT